MAASHFSAEALSEQDVYIDARVLTAPDCSEESCCSGVHAFTATAISASPLTLIVDTTDDSAESVEKCMGTIRSSTSAAAAFRYPLISSAAVWPCLLDLVTVKLLGRIEHAQAMEADIPASSSTQPCAKNTLVGFVNQG